MVKFSQAKILYCIFRPKLIEGNGYETLQTSKEQTKMEGLLHDRAQYFVLHSFTQIYELRNRNVAIG